jgi:hypothetical protein
MPDALNDHDERAEIEHELESTPGLWEQWLHDPDPMLQPGESSFHFSCRLEAARLGSPLVDRETLAKYKAALEARTPEQTAKYWATRSPILTRHEYIALSDAEYRAWKRHEMRRDELGGLVVLTPVSAPLTVRARQREHRIRRPSARRTRAGASRDGPDEPPLDAGRRGAR